MGKLFGYYRDVQFCDFTNVQKLLRGVNTVLPSYLNIQSGKLGGSMVTPCLTGNGCSP